MRFKRIELMILALGQNWGSGTELTGAAYSLVESLAHFLLTLMG